MFTCFQPKNEFWKTHFTTASHGLVDFTDPKTADEINFWIEKSTKNMISKLVDASDLDSFSCSFDAHLCILDFHAGTLLSLGGLPAQLHLNLIICKVKLSRFFFSGLCWVYVVFVFSWTHLARECFQNRLHLLPIVYFLQTRLRQGATYRRAHGGVGDKFVGQGRQIGRRSAGVTGVL